MSTLHLPPKTPRRPVAVQVQTRSRERAQQVISTHGRCRQGVKKILRWIDLTEWSRDDRTEIRHLAERILAIIDQQK